MMRAAAVAGLLVLAGCGPSERPAEPSEGTAPPPPPQSAPPFAPAAAPEERPATPVAQTTDTADWRTRALPADRERLSDLSRAWREALAEAQADHARDLAALGPLVDPAAGLPRPQPTPGLYRCRTIKLGSQAPADAHSRLAFAAYPAFRCRIDLTPGGDLTFAKLTGSQRGAGEFFPERDDRGADTARLVFLGAQAWGSDETSPPAYGRDAARDQIGVLERLGPDRYRLALPWPRQESKLDLIELERVGI